MLGFTIDHAVFLPDAKDELKDLLFILQSRLLSVNKDMEQIGEFVSTEYLRV